MSYIKHTHREGSPRLLSAHLEASSGRMAGGVPTIGRDEDQDFVASFTQCKSYIFIIPLLIFHSKKVNC